MIRPDESCLYHADEHTPWTYAWIGFWGMQAKKFDKAPDVFPLPPEIFKAMLSVFDKVQNREEWIAGILFRILAEISVPTVQKTPVETVIHYLSFNYMHAIRIEEIAAIVHLNRKYLARIFKKEIGMTMQSFLVACRMKEATRFLSAGHSVSETAVLTGYGDGFSFSKAFKKYYGQSPKDYRAQHMKKHA